MHSSHSPPLSVTGEWEIWFAKPSWGWGFHLCLEAVGKIELEVSRFQFFFPEAEKGWNAYNLYIWQWQSKLLIYILEDSRPIDHRQSTDTPPISNGQRIGRVSAAISIEISADSRSIWGVVDMSTDISTEHRSICRHTLMTVDMSTDIPVEGCTKYTWSGNSQPDTQTDKGT